MPSRSSITSGSRHEGVAVPPHPTLSPPGRGLMASEPLQRVLRASEPLTLAGVPSGFLPWLAADLARATHGDSKSGRAVAIVADEAAMRALAETVPLFAPEV